MTMDEPTLGALRASVAATRTLFAAAACSVALVDAEGELLEYVAADGAGAAEIVGVTIPVGRGIAGWAAMSGQPISVRDVRSDPRFARDVAESTNYVPTSIMAVPLVDSEGEVLGVASVLDPVVGEASDWTLQVLGTLGSHMALLVSAPRDPVGVSSPLGGLGADVVRLVEAWQAAGRRTGRQ